MPNMRGELQTDERLMINSDVAGIICESIGGCKNVAPNILKHYSQQRSVIHFVPKYFQGDKQEKTRYVMDSFWEVQGDSYDPKNWRKLQ